jgi:hypothetical protein
MGIPHVRPPFSHIDLVFGNYLGVLANWVKLRSIAAPEDKLFFSVVSWQALRLKLP